MGSKWEVELWCVTSRLGEEQWGWETVYRGQSLRQAIMVARAKKKETDGAVRVTWR